MKKKIKNSSSIYEDDIIRIDDRNFLVRSSNDSNVKYHVNFNHPSCTCYSWRTSKFLCKHVLAIFKHFDLGWDALPDSFKNNPYCTVDLAFAKINNYVPIYEPTPNNYDFGIFSSSSALNDFSTNIKSTPSNSHFKKLRTKLRDNAQIISDYSYVLENNELSNIIAASEEVKNQVLHSVNIENNLVLRKKSQTSRKRKLTSQILSRAKKIRKNGPLPIKRKSKHRSAGRIAKKAENDRKLYKPFKVPFEFQIDPSSCIDNDDVLITHVDSVTTPTRYSKLNISALDLSFLNSCQWLSEQEIIFAMNLLKNQFPEVSGFERTDLGENCYFTKHVGKFIQLINIDNLHWICVSSVINNNNEVYVYDSLKTGEYSNHIKKLISSLSDKTVKFANVQQQVESNDCGFFSLAFATSLCFGRDPETIFYTQSAMRQHLFDCFKMNRISEFP